MWSMSTRMPALDRFGGPHDADGLRERARFGPMRKLEAHEDAELVREVAQPREPRRRALAVGIGQLRDDILRAELGRGFELGHEMLGLDRRIHAEELDVEDRDAGSAILAFVSRMRARRAPGRRGTRPASRASCACRVLVARAGRDSTSCGGVHATAR